MPQVPIHQDKERMEKSLCCRTGCENKATFHFLIDTPITLYKEALGACHDHVGEAMRIFSIADYHPIYDECPSNCNIGKIGMELTDEEAELANQRIKKAIKAQDN